VGAALQALSSHTATKVRRDLMRGILVTQIVNR
jgi:hypothetical protein